MSDYSDLKRLAEAAHKERQDNVERDLKHRVGFPSTIHHLAFVREANPTALLALIAENESLRIGNSDLRKANKSLKGSCEALGKDYKQAKRERNASIRGRGDLQREFDLLRQERDHLKSEVDLLKNQVRGHDIDYDLICNERNLLKAEVEALRRDAAKWQAVVEIVRRPVPGFDRPAIGNTGCLICGKFTDHQGLPCPDMHAYAMSKEAGQ